MAEQLGQAELVITVNDADALRKLGELKKQVADLEGQAGRQVSRTRTATTKASPAEAERKRAERAAEQAANKRVSIQNRLNILEAKGVDVTAFRLRASRANEAAQQSQFDTARQINAQLSRALSIEENRLRVSAAQAAQLKRQEAAAKGTASTVTKTAQKPTGVGFATTPEQILASRGGIQKGAAENLSTREIVTDKLYQLAKRINLLEAKGVNISAQRAKFEQIIEVGKQGQLGTARQLIQNLARQLSLEENALKVARAREATEKRRAQGATGTASITRSPATQATVDAILERRAQLRSLQTAGGGGGGLTSFLRDVRQREEGERRIAAIRKAGYKDAEFAEKTLAGLTKKRASTGLAAQRRRGQGGGADAGGVISSAVIGGSFPLLFGQGGGAAGGGLIGGLLGGAFGGGGGFAGSLLGTLVGQTADKFGELAKALQDPVKNLDALIQGANLSGKGVEELAKTLVELGRTSEADALLRADLSSTIDPVGVAKVAVANDAFSRSIGDIQERLGYLLAGPAVQFTGWLDQIIQRIVGLPQNGPTQRSATATRGQGTALSVGGVLLGAAGLAAAPFTGGASLGLALGGAGLIGAGATLSGSADFQQEQIASTEQIKKIQEEIAAIEQRRISLQRNILAATRSGSTNTAFELRLQDRLLELEADKSRLKVAFNAKSGPVSLNELQNFRQGIEAIELQKQAAKDAENTRKAGVEAVIKLETTQNSLALQAIQERVAAAEDLAGIEQGILRTTKEQIINIQEGIAAAKRREQDLGAQITAARQTGDESGADRLVERQQIAAEETKLALIQGADALARAGEQIARDLEDAKLNLAELRTGNEGLNKYLRAGDRRRREQETFESLQPSFREAQIRFKELTGAEAPEFRGRTSDVNREIIDFIKSVRTEDRAAENVTQLDSALLANTNAQFELRTALDTLTQKEWTVQVTANVPIDAQSQLELNRASTL